MPLAELARPHELPRGEKILTLQQLTLDLSAEEINPLTPTERLLPGLHAGVRPRR